jgi:hypothetical protein
VEPGISTVICGFGCSKASRMLSKTCVPSIGDMLMKLMCRMDKKQ